MAVVIQISLYSIDIKVTPNAILRDDGCAKKNKDFFYEQVLEIELSEIQGESYSVALSNQDCLDDEFYLFSTNLQDQIPVYYVLENGRKISRASTIFSIMNEPQKRRRIILGVLLKNKNVYSMKSKRFSNKISIEVEKIKNDLKQN